MARGRGMRIALAAVFALVEHIQANIAITEARSAVRIVMAVSAGLDGPALRGANRTLGAAAARPEKNKSTDKAQNPDGLRAHKIGFFSCRIGEHGSLPELFPGPRGS